MSQPSSQATASSTGAPSASAAGTGLPDPALAPPALPASEVGFTAQDLIDRQLQLEREAHEACPFAVSRCTHSNGPARQLVFSCRTCAERDGEGPKGVCAACSVACHAEHDLVELFHRRNFRCDCGATKSTEAEKKVQPCTLREPPFAVENDSNRYDHNFDGEFCYCERGKVYNPHEEKETMFQCLICEDWLHESCTSLKRSTDKAGATDDDTPSLLDHELFEHLICDSCVRSHLAALEPYIGTRGWIFCLPERVPASMLNVISQEAAKEEWDAQPVRSFDDGVEAWKVFGLPAGSLASDTAGTAEPASASGSETAPASAPAPAVPAEPQVPNASSALDAPVVATGETAAQAATIDAAVTTALSTLNEKKKRALSPQPGADADASEEAGPSKRAKLAEEARASTEKAAGCQKPSTFLMRNIKDLPAGVRLDLFLMPIFRERICHCEKCLPTWSALPFVLDEEPTLSPPPTSTPSESGSTYSLGLAALNHLPREHMLTALSHYQDFRTRLFALLQPFAESGQTVDEETIRAFTARLMQKEGGGAGEAGAGPGSVGGPSSSQGSA